jgi:hypothetical protein
VRTNICAHLRPWTRVERSEQISVNATSLHGKEKHDRHLSHLAGWK